MKLSEWETKYRKPKLSAEMAVASRLPCQSGDGYSFGGASVVCIGYMAVLVGEGGGSFELASEIARRWNRGDF